jgi:pantothenate kinase
VAERFRQTAVGLAAVSMDGFQLANEEFDADGFWNPIFRLAVETSTSVYVPAFSREVDEPVAGAVCIDSECRVVVDEGNYLLGIQQRRALVRQLLAEGWFLDIDGELRIRRVAGRRMKFGGLTREVKERGTQGDEVNAELVRPTYIRADLLVSMHGNFQSDIARIS